MYKSDMQHVDYLLPTSFKSSRHFRNRKKSEKFGYSINVAVKKLFKKQVEIKNDHYELPSSDTMFTESAWSIEDLQLLKKNLNEIKNTLSDYNPTEWRNHTRNTNIAEGIKWRLKRDVNPEFLTQAWCKFYEIASNFPLIPEETIHKKQLKTIHLCEAPGAFVTSLNHWLKINMPFVDWNWRATTLNPYYEGNSLSAMLCDDRFIFHTMDHWYFGADNTGNIMDLKNLDLLIELEKNDNDNVMLITADGSVDCMDRPGEQETTVSHLQFCEAVTALHLLSTNANFLLKIFTTFEHSTICLIYFLTCCFDKIIMKKPATSKAGNSEIYLICLNFKGRDTIQPYLNIFRKYYENGTTLSMFRKKDIPHSFITQIVEYANYFKSFQCDEILNNIKTFKSTEDDFLYLRRIKKAVANYYIRNYKLKKLPHDNMGIVGATILNQCYSTLNNKSFYDSYNQRQKQIHMTTLERLSILNEEVCINTINNVYTFQYTDECEELKISVGAAYLKSRNSKFCESQIFKIYDSVIEIMNTLELEWFYPDKKSAMTFITNNKIINYLSFQYDLEFHNYNTAKKVYDMIIRLKEHETLVLIGYSLLTQFNVGILYLLSHTFEHVTMELISDLGCIIRLENYCVKNQTINKLKDILQAFNIAENNGQDIISVVPITTLCVNKIYQMIIDINHLIIKNFIIYIRRLIIETK
ncbi:cap-specific mRNA (nucleoside-2'-O-)-methyltransferase 2 isoform X1 [Microplitis mediator]|uniref:cap-specific mRNA (nucleoside-2'-O-)-methyltransferase 2 isoform X1 n=1 Tax=Microplitis mediator TaxID=375433 RepID=UPI0025525BC8|nr:cap-specific mRNA (nucleoside-2'-O-)-methyltransferase 2 isoform X1 [Microplitis mediator]